MNHIGKTPHLDARRLDLIASGFSMNYWGIAMFVRRNVFVAATVVSLFLGQNSMADAEHERPDTLDPLDAALPITCGDPTSPNDETFVNYDAQTCTVGDVATVTAASRGVANGLWVIRTGTAGPNLNTYQILGVDNHRIDNDSIKANCYDRSGGPCIIASQIGIRPTENNFFCSTVSAEKTCIIDIRHSSSEGDVLYLTFSQGIEGAVLIPRVFRGDRFENGPDVTPPQLLSIVRQSPSGQFIGANTASVTFRATFSEPVGWYENQHSSSIVWLADSPAGGFEYFTDRVSFPAGSIGTGALVDFQHVAEGRIFDFIVDSFSGDGTLDIDLTGTFYDSAGLSVTDPVPVTEQNYIRDSIASQLVSFNRQFPIGPTTDRDTLRFRAFFNDTVFNISPDDFVVTGTTGTVDSVSDPSGTFVDIFVSGGDLPALNGEVGLNLANGKNIADVYGNVIPTTEPAIDQTYTMSNPVQPRVVSIVRYAPASDHTASDSLSWRITFNEPVENVSAADFSLSGTTASLSVNNLSTTLVEVTANGGNLASLSGVVTLDFSPGQNIAAVTGGLGLFPLSQGADQRSYSVDNTRPTASITAPNAINSLSPFQITVTFSEPVYFFTDVGEIGAFNANVSAPVGSSTTYTAMVTPIAPGPILVGVIDGAALDQTFVNANLGSPLVQIDTDTAAPTLTSITRQAPAAERTNADTLSWRLTFSEPVTGIDVGDFVISGTTANVTSIQSVAGPASVSGGSAIHDITISGGNLPIIDGTVVLALANSASIVDSANNALSAVLPVAANENSFNLTNSPPELTVFGSEENLTRGEFIASFVFDRDVTGFDIGDIDVVNATLSNFQTLTSRAYVVLVSPQADGLVSLFVPAGAAVDDLQNGNRQAELTIIRNDDARRLTLVRNGAGSGTLSSTSPAIDCGSTCERNVILGDTITLNASAAQGSTFESWLTNGCPFNNTASCEVTIAGDTTVTGRFVLSNPPATFIAASVTPSVRSMHLGGPDTTAFAAVYASPNADAQSCNLAFPGGLPAAFSFRQLDANGQITGFVNQPFDVPAGSTRTLHLNYSPTTQTPDSGFTFFPNFICDNATSDPVTGINSLLLNVGNSAGPDVVSFGYSLSQDGVIRIPASASLGIMTVQAVNIGVGDGSAGAGQATMTVNVDTGDASLPLVLAVCEANLDTGLCTSPVGSSVTSVWDANITRSFAVFATDISNGGGIPLDPANARAFIRFADANDVTRSITSMAVTAPAAGDAFIPPVSGSYSVQVRQPVGDWPSLRPADLVVAVNGQAILDDGIAPRLIDLSDAQSRPVNLGGLPTLGQAHEQVTEAGDFWGVPQMFTQNIQPPARIVSRFAGCELTAWPIEGVVFQVALTGCEIAGSYSGIWQQAENDNEAPVIAFANEVNGYRAIIGDF